MTGIIFPIRPRRCSCIESIFIFQTVQVDSSTKMSDIHKNVCQKLQLKSPEQFALFFGLRDRGKFQLFMSMSRGTAFPTRFHVRLANTQISLRVRAVLIFAGRTCNLVGNGVPRFGTLWNKILSRITLGCIHISNIYLTTTGTKIPALAYHVRSL